MKLSGSRLGPYEIQSAIGAGGMGEVYRARDTRLDRMVAVKVIAGLAASDPSFRERFDREARAISSLDHPHICTLYDVGHENGVDFLVMQLLEGQTLAERMARGRPASDPSTGSGSGVSSATSAKGPITIEQALRYGAEIANALDAAHKRGIVHRDLKPGNIIITKSGSKLLDFGLAKLAEQPTVAGMGEGVTHTVPLTGTGSIVGTLNYMAPEQLEGGVIDTRTDIFAFGAVLYEMLTGRRAFNAQSHAGLIAAILNDQAPPLDTADLKTALPIAAHRALERLIRKCLAKDPDERWQSAADLAGELRWIEEERQRWAAQPETVAQVVSSAASRRRERWWMGVAAIAVLAGAAGVAWALRRPDVPPEPAIFTIDNEAIASGPGFLAVSPNGRYLALAMGGRNQGGPLGLRSLTSTEIRLLPGTEGAWQPFWSPDGRSIAFSDRRSAGASLKRIDISGGPVTTLASSVRSRGAWSPAGVILIDQKGQLASIPERGGSPTPATTLDRAAGESAHLWPQFLPDGRRFLFLALHGDRSKNAIYLGSLDSPHRTRLIKADSSFELSGGYLLYQHQGTVFAQEFDPHKGVVKGDPQPIVEGVNYNALNGRASIAASASADVLAYRAGQGVTGFSTLQWLDLKGKAISTLGEPDVATRTVSVSPDGSRVAVSRLEPDGRTHIYVIDAARNVSTRLTSEPYDHTFPVWSPDGAWIYFGSTRKGPMGIYRRAASGGRTDEPVYEPEDASWPLDISRDGKFLLVLKQTGSLSSRDLWAVPLTGERTAFPVVASKFTDEGGRFSPDGKWVAYHSDDMDDRNVYVEPFPPTGFRARLSTTPGLAPFWSADGRGVYYFSEDFKLMLVDVRPNGNTVEPAAARELFQLPRLQVGGRVHADWRNQRLLAPVVRESENVPSVHVVLNWQRALLK